MQRQIVLDTETTGLLPEKGHRIIEIGCLELINRRLTGSYFHRYVKPERSIERAAEEVHGLTLEFLADKPTFNEIAQELFDYIKKAELIIHNAPFDIGFLDHEFKLAKTKFHPIVKHCSVTDTLTIARRKHPGQHNKLDALCRRYKVNNSHREWHGALLDAELLAQVYLLMTGGQTQLFETDEPEMRIAQSTVTSQPLMTERKPLRVIQATSEERAAHEAYLAMMKKNGNCLWQDDE